ncbi:ankyrin [Backusella circina FSU 941]|nr:ankyrin [Backusella circina FSU 941]
MDQIGDEQFVSIDLSLGNVLPIRYDQGKSFPLSIWEAAIHANMDALDYYIQMAMSETEKEEEEDDDVQDITRFLNSRDPDTCCTLLHLAISHNKNPIKILEFLLEKGADPTIPNIYGIQAIHSVILHCPEPLECIELLLRYDQNVNACDNDDWTPLHYAARFCKDPGPIFQLLIDRGANINALNSANKTPLFSLLAGGDHSHVLKSLLENQRMVNLHLKGDFLNTKNRQTKIGSLLLQATKYGRLNSLQVLIDYVTTAGILNIVTDRQELLFGIDIAQEELASQRTEGFEQIIDILRDSLQRFDIIKALPIVDDEKQTIQPFQPFSFLQKLIWN